jgi:ERCC4-type nuclease
VIDTRERYGYAFRSHDVTLARRPLRVGDYGVEANGTLVAAVERKSLDDFSKTLVVGSLNFAAAELSRLRSAAIVVEGTYSALLRHEYTRPGYLPELVARLQVRYPNVPIVFLESRKVAEERTFRFLRAAHAEGAEAPLLSAIVPVPAVQGPVRKKRRARARALEPPS